MREATREVVHLEQAGVGHHRRAMKRVYLLRHAKSSWKHPELADHDRPLAGRGKRAAKSIGGHMRAQELVPELVLCSTARRARETRERIEPALGRAPVRVERELYGASARELLARLRRLRVGAGDRPQPGHARAGGGARRLGAGARGQIPHGGAGHARFPRIGLGRARARSDRAGRAHPAARSVTRTLSRLPNSQTPPYAAPERRTTKRRGFLEPTRGLEPRTPSLPSRTRDLLLRQRKSGLPSGIHRDHGMSRRRLRCGSIRADPDGFGPKPTSWGPARESRSEA
jgi:hypothetical protein